MRVGILLCMGDSLLISLSAQQSYKRLDIFFATPYNRRAKTTYASRHVKMLYKYIFSELVGDSGASSPCAASTLLF